VNVFNLQLMNVFVIILQRYRLQPTVLRLRSTVVSGMDKKRFHRVRYSQMCGTQFYEGQTATVHAGFQFRLQRSVQRARWFVCIHDRYNKMSLSIFTEPIGKDILSKCNTCFTNPCSNEGFCEPLPERQYKCRCNPGYHGKHCENMIDACYGNPCRNSGTCKLLEEGRFR